MPTYKKDFAPGEPHIALRRKGIAYYVPALFHLALTYQQTVPLFISDVLRSTDPFKIYGQHALDVGLECCFLIKNHPLKKFTIMGRLMLFECHELPGRNGSANYTFSVLYLDDSLGENLTISVRVDSHLLSAQLLDRCEPLVKVTGVLGKFNGQKQMLASDITICGKFTSFDTELAWWTAVLKSRKYLELPWRYIPPETKIEEKAGPKVVFEHRDIRTRKAKQNILIRSKSQANSIARHIEQDFCGVMDSFAVYRGKKVRFKEGQLEKGQLKKGQLEKGRAGKGQSEKVDSGSEVHQRQARMSKSAKLSIVSLAERVEKI